MLILASNSPRRHELLKLLRLPFKIQSSAAEEISTNFAEDPIQIAIENAKIKAIDVSKKFPDDTIIVENLKERLNASLCLQLEKIIHQKYY